MCIYTMYTAEEVWTFRPRDHLGAHWLKFAACQGSLRLASALLGGQDGKLFILWLWTYRMHQLCRQLQDGKGQARMLSQAWQLCSFCRCSSDLSTGSMTRLFTGEVLQRGCLQRIGRDSETSGPVIQTPQSTIWAVSKTVVAWWLVRGLYNPWTGIPQETQGLQG